MCNAAQGPQYRAQSQWRRRRVLHTGPRCFQLLGQCSRQTPRPPLHLLLLNNSDAVTVAEGRSDMLHASYRVEYPVQGSLAAAAAALRLGPPVRSQGEGRRHDTAPSLHKLFLRSLRMTPLRLCLCLGQRQHVVHSQDQVAESEDTQRARGEGVCRVPH